ncbi:MAG TPA: hypothetical protein VN851_06655 [Thermoanaerobaculia bacterium]|nr:hypothetical protein [Thermoanaerobaculia bacterium]
MKRIKRLALGKETLVNLQVHQRQRADAAVAVAAGPSDPGYFTCNETVCGTCECDTLVETYCCCITVS